MNDHTPERPRRTAAEDDEDRGEEAEARTRVLFQRLELARGWAGLSVEEFCARARVKFNFYKTLGRGGTIGPSFFRIMRLAAVAGVSSEWLAGHTDDPHYRGAPLPIRPKTRKRG